MGNPVEAPNNLVSNTRLTFLDLLSEGTIGGFWPVSGVSGNSPLCSVYFDGVPLMNGDGSTNYNLSGQGFQFDYRSGTSGQFAISGFDKPETFIPLPSNTRTYNPPTGAGYYRPVVAAFNSTQYPDAEAVKVTVRVPALYAIDDDQNTNTFNISYGIDVSLNGGEWQPVMGDTIYGKCTSDYFRTTLCPLPKTPPQNTNSWKVRVRRTSQNILSSRVANELFVHAIAVVSSSTYRYPMSALAGIQITADQFGSIPSRAYDIKGIKVAIPQGYTPTQYNVTGSSPITPAVYPAVWDGTFAAEKQWTDNPAWIFYDLITNKRYGLGNYVRTEWMDKWTLYQIAQFCDQMVDDGEGGLEPQFTCNVAITQAQDAYTLMNNLVSVFRGMLYWANGRIIPVGSETRSPVFNFTNANVVNGMFNYSDTPRNTRSTVVTTKWLDPQNQFRPTPERIEDTEGIARFGYVEKQVGSFACTSRGQAIRGANWILTVEQQLTETVLLQTDLEGLYMRPGDIFGVYDNYRTNQQQGGRILSFDSTRSGMVLDRQVNLQPGLTYFMSTLVPKATYTASGDITGSDQIDLIRNSQFEVRRVYTPAGSGLSTITVSGAFTTGLMPGAPFILSASGTNATIFDQAIQYRCLATSEPSNGVTEILGVRYQTGINTYVTRNYSAVTTPVINGDLTPPGPATGLFVTGVSGLMVNNAFYTYAALVWSGSKSANLAYYRVTGIDPGGSPVLIGQPQTTGMNYSLPVTGRYAFLVGAVNANGVGSAFTSGSFTLGSANPLGVTAPLSGIYIMPEDNGLEGGPDYYYTNSSGAPTGYIGLTPTFVWNITQTNGYDEPTSQFISGYRIRLLKLGNESTSLMNSDVYISGKENQSYQIPAGYLYTGYTVAPLRGFTFSVDTVDNFGNTRSGARLAVNNVIPLPPTIERFLGFNGGFNYTINPTANSDASGLAFWWNNSSGFTPTYGNYNLVTNNIVGTANTDKTNPYYVWYSILDNFGTGGSLATSNDYTPTIRGPIAINPNSVISGVTNYGYTLTPDGRISGMASIAPTGGGTTTPYGRFDKLIFAGCDLQSDNYVAGLSGWLLTRNGVFEANSGLFRTTLEIGTGGNRIHIDTNGLVGGYGDTDGLDVRIGNQNGIDSAASFTANVSGNFMGLWQPYLIGAVKGSYLFLQTIGSGYSTSMTYFGGLFLDKAPLNISTADVTVSNGNIYTFNGNVASIYGYVSGQSGLFYNGLFTSGNSTIGGNRLEKQGITLGYNLDDVYEPYLRFQSEPSPFNGLYNARIYREEGNVGNLIMENVTGDIYLSTSNSSYYAAFGTYVGTPVTSAGYITIRDQAGNLRKLMVGT